MTTLRLSARVGPGKVDAGVTLIAPHLTTMSATPAKAPFIRVATSNDLDELARMNQKAFISSAPQTFFSGANRVLLPLQTQYCYTD